MTGSATRTITVVPLTAEHGDDVVTIYQAGIDEGNATFAAGIWTVQSGIFPENAASLAVHDRAGFRVIGTRERVGCHHGVWRDTVLVERRSPRID